MTKVVYIDREDGDESHALYIDGKYVTGHYYLIFDGVLQVIKHFDPDAIIECWLVSDKAYEDMNGFPPELPENFIEEWECTAPDWWNP